MKPSLSPLKKNLGVQANVNHIKTPLKRPHLVGSYHFHTFIRVVTPNGDVVGTGLVRKNNNYNVQIVVPFQSILAEPPVSATTERNDRA